MKNLLITLHNQELKMVHGGGETDNTSYDIINFVLYGSLIVLSECAAIGTGYMMGKIYSHKKVD